MDPDDGAAEPLLVGADLGGEIRERGLAAVFPAQLLTSGLYLPTLPANAARPRVLAERIDHGPTHTPLGKRLELDAATFVETLCRVDETDDPVLDKIADVDRVGHGRGNAAGQLLDKGDTCNDSRILCGAMGAHDRHLGTRIAQLGYHTAEPVLSSPRADDESRL